MTISLFFLLLAVSLAAIVCYIAGSRKIKKLSRMIAQELEEGIKPATKEYINIGGHIGYHANFEKKGTIHKIKATFTFIPRHSLFFLPLSLLITKRDRLYLTFFTEKKIPGEAHLIRKDISRQRNHQITNKEKLFKETLEINSNPYYLYYENKKAKQHIEKIYKQLIPKELLHLCLFPENKNIYLFQTPSQKTIAPNIEAILTLHT